jgi:endonuclease YncB( thermonuclease family)
VEQIKLRRGVFLGLGLFSILAAAGAFAINLLGPVVAPTALTLEAAAERPTLIKAGASAQFSICGSVRRTCVVDGDTFWLDGVKIRIADIDTPEIGQPQCDREYQLGMKATYRLVELLNAGPFELRTIGGRDEDRFGRKLRVLIRGGRSLGDQLVSQGLARTWSGRREPWC